MIGPPLALIAELTYRCPLKCVYCSNPLEMKTRKTELRTPEWIRVLSEARSLGAVQTHFTGGEPLVRNDLVELVRSARQLGLYVNLITSGVGLTEARLDALVEAGVDHLQLSFQDADAGRGNTFSGVKSHDLKLEAAALIRTRKVAFTINLVIHRENADHLEAMIQAMETLGAEKLEIAHVQYVGWAFKNRGKLLPSRAQVEHSIQVVEHARKRLSGKIRIDFVAPDYHARFPKACMGGWAQKLILINPNGSAMPCHSATIIPGLELPSVRDHELAWIWKESPAFQKFRGEEWMSEPCAGCERRKQDFGGCRCQALLLAGDASLTDPVCSLSPHRERVTEIIRNAAASGFANDPWAYRKGP